MHHISAEILAMTTGDIADNSKTIFSLVTGGALAIAAAAKAVTKIEQGEKGIRTHFGKPKRKDGSYYGFVGPGIHFAAPFTHSIKRVSTQDRVSKLERITADLYSEVTGNPKQTIIVSTAMWGIEEDCDSLFKAAYIANNEKELEKAVIAITSQGLRRAINLLSHESAIHARDLTGGVQQECQEELSRYGVALRAINTGTVARSQSEVLLGNNAQLPIFNPVTDAV